MPAKFLSGEIVFGIDNQAINAIWKRQHNYVTFYLSEPIPDGPYAGRLIINKPFTKWHKFLPYEIAGTIINETLAERKA
jgi:hypothetical protein